MKMKVRIKSILKNGTRLGIDFSIAAYGTTIYWISGNVIYIAGALAWYLVFVEQYWSDENESKNGRNNNTIELPVPKEQG
jgi:hypothetical protein